MIPLSKECIYAVTMEIIKGYLEGQSQTLREIGESDIVRLYCGRTLPESTVYYIRKTVDAIPSLRSLFRGPQHVPKETYTITAINVKKLPDFMLNWVSSLTSLWYDSRFLEMGEWWVNEVYLALKGFMNMDKLYQNLVNKVSELISSYEESISYLTDDIIFYKRRSKNYHIYVKIRRPYIRSKNAGCQSGVHELVELREALKDLQQNLNEISKARDNDPNSLIRTIVKVVAMYLRPFASKQRYLRMTRAVVSEAIVLVAIATVANLLDEEVASLVNLGRDKIVGKIKSRRWKNEVIRRALNAVIEQVKNSDFVRADIIEKWVDSNPVRLSRARITFDDKPRLTFLVDVVFSPCVET